MNEVCREGKNSTMKSAVLLMFCITLLGLLWLFAISDKVFAAGGPGEGGTAVNTYNCNNTSTFTVNVCPDHTGGASWHLFKLPKHSSSNIYKLYQLYKNGPRYCKKTSGYNKPGCSRIKALSGTSIDYDGKLAKKCIKSDSMQYYMAFVFDGANGNDNKSLTGKPKKKNVFTYWGPAAYRVPLKGKSKDYVVHYNNYKAKNVTEIEEGLTKGTNMHTWKLTQRAAAYLYKSMNRKHSADDWVPKGHGYECLETRTVSLYAVNEENGKLLSKTPIDYVKVMRYRNPKVKVENPKWRPTVTIGGVTYTYQKKICKTKEGTGCVSANSYQVKEITQDKKFYAMYKAPVKVEKSDIAIEVKNDSDSANQEYKTYKSTVFAKPGDKVKYRVTYEPDAQKGYTWEVKSVKVGSQELTSRSKKKIGDLWTAWENKFSVNGLWTKTFTRDNGSSATTVVESTDCVSNCVIEPSNVGSVVEEYVNTSSNTPTKVTKSGDSATVWRSVLSDVAKVKVPYNFKMSAEVKQFTDAVYAGEVATNVGEFKVSLRKKANGVTTDGSTENAYATGAKNVAGKVIVFLPGSGEDVEEDWLMDDDEQSVDYGEDGIDDEESQSEEDEFVEEDTEDDSDGNDGILDDDLGDDENEDELVECGNSEDGSRTCRNISSDDLCEAIGSAGSCSVTDVEGIPEVFVNETSGKFSFNVPDITAGSYVCTIAAVYPADSGEDDNLEVSGYKDAWRLSEPKCFIVAKRPSLQVWGGNVYSVGRIGTTVADKKVTIGRKFGSWGELGVISFNGSNGFGSGASLGYQSIDINGVVQPKYSPANGNGNNPSDVLGGNKDVLYPLTIPNQSVSFANVSTTGSGITSDLASVISKFGYKGAENIPDKNNVILNDNNNLKDAENNIYYYYGRGNLTIPAQWVRNGIQVVHATGDIRITGNLMYLTSSYVKLSDIPKLVIYSEKDVKIDCPVGRIDALIIADNVDTCGNSEDVNSRDNSYQLRVNGAIITGSLKANRTYGAATGANSMIPAEIINFDPTLYKWGGKEADNDDNGDEMSNDGDIHLESVYTRELAPRQ